VLTRCQEQNQSAYEPLFRQATDIMSEYRKAMGLRGTLGGDINWINPSESGKPRPNNQAAKKKQP